MKLLKKEIPNSLDNYNYIVLEESTQTAYFFDPFDPAFMFKTFPELNNYREFFILNTHHHGDHIRGNQWLIDNYQADLLNLEGKPLESQTFRIEFYATNGHTMPHSSFLIYTQGERTPAYLISGDFLFNAGVGNCKNGGDVDVLYQSLSGIPLEEWKKTMVLPGHNYMKRNLEFAKMIEPDNSTIDDYYKNHSTEKSYSLEQELTYNPFLRLGELKDKSEFSKMTEYEIFISLRKKRDNF